MTKSIPWFLMVLFAIGVGLYALAAALVPALRAEFVTDMISTNASGSILHFLGGGIVIVAGAFQFNSRLRTGYPGIHRILGWIYVCGAIVGGLAGLYLSFYSNGGLVAHWGFGSLAVCWLLATITAFLHVRAGRIRLHQDWMIRSYALTLAAVTLRIYLPISQIAGFPFDDAYQAISWVCWVPNLVIAEWFLVPRSNKKPVLS